MLLFNQNFGYLEGLVRGFKNGLLNQSEYQALTQCDTLEDLKIHLSVSIDHKFILINIIFELFSDQGTSYGTFLNDEAGVISSTTISNRLRDKMVAEFEHMRSHSSGKLTKFLDYISYKFVKIIHFNRFYSVFSYMIDNICLLINGTLNRRQLSELVPKVRKLI